MNLIFFGSSEFSLYALRACLESAYQVALIITTPAQKQGRGLRETPTPVFEFAQSKKILSQSPSSLKDPELLNRVSALKPAIFVVSSYGKIIPSSWLTIPSTAALNVHPSLLPYYRGAAPIQWPLILGDTRTGISIAEVTAELDAGDIYFQQSVPIPAEANAADMTSLLGEESQKALALVLDRAVKGLLTKSSQNHLLSNYARKLIKEDGRINWERSAASLVNQIRGLQPWPGVYFPFQGEPLQVLQAKRMEYSNDQKPGTILKIEKDLLIVQTKDQALALRQVKPAGKNIMSAGDFARGKRLQPGFVLEGFPEAKEFVIPKSYK